MAERFNTPDAAKKLGARLKKARITRKLTLTTVAAAAGVHHAQISRIERGEMATLSKNLQKLCKFLGVSPAVDPAKNASSHLGDRVNALVSSSPANEAAISLLIDALEELVEAQA